MNKANKFMSLFIIGILVTLMFGAFYQPADAKAHAERDLSVGKIGGDVRQLQIDLTRKGYKLEPYNGVYGLKTMEAVSDLQKKNGIKPTGVFDEETRKVLINKNAKKDSSKVRSASVPVSRSYSRHDVMILARAINGEARGESLEGQVAVAAVILNRTQSKDFPGTIKGVIFQPGAFDAVDDGQIWLEPSQKSIKAAELALSGYDPTGEAIYYWNPAKTTNKWIWSRPIVKRIGEHVFAR